MHDNKNHTLIRFQDILIFIKITLGMIDDEQRSNQVPRCSIEIYCYYRIINK